MYYGVIVHANYRRKKVGSIAACVVGGISFNGGIGKIRGAVLGVIIFTVGLSI